MSDAAVEGQRCPMCGSDAVAVVEDVSDEVSVFECDECGATWADRTA